MITDVPETLLEAVRYFADLSVCNEYMRRIKWPSGHVVCPHCGGDRCVDKADGKRLRCRDCRKDFSYKVGTIFEDSPLGLDKWFVAVWSIANCKNGISSHELGRALGVTQKTAWRMLFVVKLAKRISEMVVFKVLADWPGYRVGSDGSIWTRWRKGPGADLSGEWKQMQSSTDREGYRRVDLHSQDGKVRTRKVAGLVCVAFNGERLRGLEVRHVDGDNANDAADNLAWGTPLENHADKRRHGTIASGDRHGRTKLTAAQIAELLSLQGKVIQREAAEKFGVSRGYVGQLWKGTRKRVAV